MGRVVITVLGMVADMELEFIRDRQRAGIEAAKGRGVYKWRRQSVSDASIRSLVAERMTFNIPMWITPLPSSFTALEKGHMGQSRWKLASERGHVSVEINTQRAEILVEAGQRVLRDPADPAQQVSRGNAAPGSTWPNGHPSVPSGPP